jgi:hypothetical protein
MPSYAMINPVSQGTAKTVVKANSPIDAANKLYNKLSQHFSSNVEKFAFTIQDFDKKSKLGKGSYKDYHHFLATELRGTKNINAVKVQIEQIEIKKKHSNEIQKNFATVVSEIKNTNKLKGGGYLGDIYDIGDDDADLFEDEDSDEEWIYNIHRHEPYRKLHPISDWWYYPWSYYDMIPSTYINIPTFRLNMSPYVRLMPPLSSVMIVKKETKVVPPDSD